MDITPFKQKEGKNLDYGLIKCLSFLPKIFITDILKKKSSW